MKITNKFYKLLLVLVLVLGLSLTIGCGDETTTEINTDLTDSFALTSAYENKNFLKDGIGKVTLSLNVDGDTAHFRDSSGKYFSARFEFKYTSNKNKNTTISNI